MRQIFSSYYKCNFSTVIDANSEIDFQLNQPTRCSNFSSLLLVV